MKQYLFFLLVIALFLSITFFKISNKEMSSDIDYIKIGVIEPLSGANAAGGEMEAKGIKLANELYPEVLGKKVELIIVDNKSKKVEAANAASYLVNREKVTAVIGSWGSTFSIAAGPIFRESEIPAVGASCTNPLVTMDNKFYSRVCFIDSFQGTVMANYAHNELNAKRVVIISETSSDYSIGLVNYFEEALTRFTGSRSSIIAKVSYDTGDVNFEKQLLYIKNLKPDVIFAPGNYTEGAHIVKQARELGISAPFIATDTWESSQFLEIGGEYVEGVVISTFFTTEVPMTDESTRFVNEFRNKYDEEPTSVASLGYDAYLVILNAIDESGSLDPIVINKYIAQTRGFEGAAGYISLNSNGDAIKSAVLKEVRNGKFEYLTIVEPVE